MDHKSNAAPVSGAKQWLENAGKAVTVLTDGCKLGVLATLCAFAIAAIASPAWAKDKLQRMGLTVKEVSVFGVKLVANNAFDTADALADTKAALEALKSDPGNSGASSNVTSALAALERAQAHLQAQGENLRTVLKDAGAGGVVLPSTGWLYVGLVSEAGNFMPSPRVDPNGTKLEGTRVVHLKLSGDAVVLQNGDDCRKTKMEDVKPPTQDELQTLQLMLRSGSRELEVLDTATCVHARGPKAVFAKVRIAPADVKFTKFENLVHS